MQTRDISVIIPAYNAQSFIIAALDSVAAQQCLPKDVVVVNDGSSDATAELVAAWITKEERSFAVHLVNQANGGISVARNSAIRHSGGAWIALLDADDIWEPDHLAALAAAVALVPGAVAAYGAGRLLVGDQLQDLLYDEFWDNPSVKLGQPIAASSCLRMGRNVFERLVVGNFIKPSSLMFARAAAERIGLFDEALRTGEDREFLVRLLFEGDFVYHPRSITQYRWHDDNVSQTKNARRNMENSLRVLATIIANKALPLQPAQVDACRRELRSATRAYLYVCATTDLASYKAGLGVVKALFGQRSMLAAVNAKHLVRCLLPRQARAA